MFATDAPQPGRVMTLSPSVRRLTAGNGGPMTGPGTNTYLLGERSVVVLDPGPDDEDHRRAIAAATGGDISHIVVTHTHRDHSPGAAPLAAQTGARLVGLPPPQAEHQDTSFVPDVVPADGETLCLGGVTLQAIHTPGHASNHVCYLLPDAGLLFTGDHVMQGSTVVIPVPDGDMAAYMDSLRKVQSLAPRAIGPGHGSVIVNPERALERLLRHRLQREARVLDRLTGLGSATTDQLLEVVYSDVPVFMHPVARLSLLAHLLKLRDEARIAQNGDRWEPVDG